MLLIITRNCSDMSVEAGKANRREYTATFCFERGKREEEEPSRAVGLLPEDLKTAGNSGDESQKAPNQFRTLR